MPPMPQATVKPGYRPQSDDTSIDADVLMFTLLRQLTPTLKAQRVQKLDLSIRKLSPTRKAVIEDPLSLASMIANRLESLGINYYIGGSLVSSLLGESRYSEDLDLVIEVAPYQSSDLIQALENEFYISEIAVEDALYGRCTSFNIISLASSEKIDLFIARTDPFSRSKMARRIKYSLSNRTSVWLCSAEDIILQKLLWGKASRSEKQWRDVLGVLKVQCETLDYSYLTDWADELGLLDSLTQALTQSGL
jgi:hypothetical protein